jgi:hypothetical protein
MKTIKINNKEYNMLSPTNEEYKKQYIKSFGDKIIDVDQINVEIIDYSIDGYHFEIKANTDQLLKVEFFDEKDNLIYDTELKSGMYSKLNRSYFTKWKTKLNLNNNLFEHNFNLENSRVFIVFESSSLGDTIAWMPYCEEFRKKHNCHVIVSTFRNDMFKNFILI